jgi:hypothetical protein
MKVAIWDTYVPRKDGRIASEEMEWNIAQKGYYIIEMEGCE